MAYPEMDRIPNTGTSSVRVTSTVSHIRNVPAIFSVCLQKKLPLPAKKLRLPAKKLRLPAKKLQLPAIFLLLTDIFTYVSDLMGIAFPELEGG